jgi:hypothetical protein
MTAVGTERVLGDLKFNSKAGKQINYIIDASPDSPGSVLFTSNNYKKKECVVKTHDRSETFVLQENQNIVNYH